MTVLSPSNFVPLGVVDIEDEPLSPTTINRMAWSFLFLGLAARAIRYGLAFPIWQDEAYLAMNYLDRGYMGLTGPLDCHQVCPILFLWVEHTLVKLFGFSVASLRLLPFVCGVASLFIFRHLAARLLRGTAYLFAVAIFAVAYPLIRYSCEAKPYSVDMFCSLVLLTLAVIWWIDGRTSRLWWLAVLTPVGLGFSFPTVFTAAGISMAIGLALLANRSRKGRGAWLCYNVSLLAGFGVLYALSVRNQTAGELEWMQDCWQSVFPPLDSAVGFIKWLVVVHSSEMLQYPMGGARGASVLTAICCGAALVFLWRRRQIILMAFCLAPLLPNFVAACMSRYPYGGHVRFALFLAPSVCLLAGLGAAALLVHRTKHGVVYGRTSCIVLSALLALTACGAIVRDFIFPYRTESVLHHRDFARWFWPSLEADAPILFWEKDIAAGSGSPITSAPVAALYLCNRAIYHQPLDDVRSASETLAAKRPFTCVRFASYSPDGSNNICGSPSDDRAWAEWLDDIRGEYDLTGVCKYELPINNRRHGRDAELLCTDTVMCYRFVPKTRDDVP